MRFSDESGRILKLLINGNLTDQTGQVIQKAEGTLSVMAILILLCLISIITILLFRKRKKQLLLAGVLIILSTGLIALLLWYAFSMKAAFSMNVIPGLNMGLPVFQ
ncbi:MAG: DUF4293 family protein [Bacteroidales bacterium]|nr:DUF4293 family protein [Bacteroidales bacterium]